MAIFCQIKIGWRRTRYVRNLLFIEKPDQKTARRLIRAGGLWNTMIMVFKTKTMLHWVSRLAPGLYQQFQQIYEAIETPAKKTWFETSTNNCSR